MPTTALKGSEHNSQVPKMRKAKREISTSSTRGFSIEKDTVNKITRSSACASGSAGIRQTSKDLLACCFSAFSLPTREAAAVPRGAQPSGTQLLRQHKQNFRHAVFNILPKTYLQILLNACDFSYSNLKILKIATANGSRTSRKNQAS